MSFPSWSVTMDDLVERNGLYYQKFINVPFSGNVTGNKQGLINKGKQEGVWVSYRENGQLRTKGNYKNGKQEGVWVEYWDNGQLRTKGNWKSDNKEGLQVSYWKNGQLYIEGNWNGGKKEGSWVTYNKDGTLYKLFTGMFKNDVKISD